MRNILVSVAIAAIALIVGYFAASYYNFFKHEPTNEEQSTVLLEKIKTVSKLVTIEGYFSEVWQVKKTPGYWDFGYMSKSAILKVKGKVSVGYNLEKMKIESFTTEKIIRISNMPSPEIISVDHDLEYFSIQEGTFTSFSSKELSDFNSAAKDTLVAAAQRSRLFDAANEKGNDVIKLIELIAKDAGWKVEYEMGPTVPNILGVSDSIQGCLTPFQHLDSATLDFDIQIKNNGKDATRFMEGYRPMAG